MRKLRGVPCNMSKCTPVVSIIVPAYNAGSLIGLTIDSVIAQSFFNWELIVVNDCSTDNTANVVDEYAKRDSRIKLIKLEENMGAPAGPRNYGVRLAEGQFVAFLDADDIWHPEKLVTQLKLLEQLRCDLVCSSVLNFYDDTNIQFRPIKNLNCISISYVRERFRNQIPTSSVIVKTKLARQFPFNEAKSYRAVEDYDTWLRMLESGVICLKIKAPLVMYRKIQGQISGSKLQMAKKVLMVHRNRSAGPSLASYLYTFTHLVGAFYSRVLLKRM